MRKLRLLAFAVLALTAARAQTFKTLVSYDNTNGANPGYVYLAQGRDGNLYSTTTGGGANGDGTIFKINPSGVLTSLYSFSGGDGSNPWGALGLGSDGNFYSTASGGGANGDGTVFKITPGGTLTVLHSFNYTDGATPFAGVLQGTDGKFYGTSYGGGVNADGTVFRIGSDGALTTIHSFNCTDGCNPIGGLAQGGDGKFYGTTFAADGTVFKISSAGALTTIHSFSYFDGAGPTAGLVQGTDGRFYGTTDSGGMYGYGTVFKVTASGTFTILHSFDCTDGCVPTARLVQATDGNLYGTTREGGTNSNGTVFKVSTGGSFSTLHNFSGADGAAPYGGLAQHTNGKLYGVTFQGGSGTACSNGCGTVFSIDVGLAPFVRPMSASGKAGQSIQILGQGFTGTTSVKFGTGSASFTVVSDTYLTAVVPVTGTTGKVTVVTPAATLTSNITFKVIPVINSFMPTSGPVGTQVTITGSGFTGATKVTFGGVKAPTFTVNSATKVTATVPTGAKTGRIAVTTPGGSASSATIFTVTP